MKTLMRFEGYEGLKVFHVVIIIMVLRVMRVLRVKLLHASIIDFALKMVDGL